MNGPGCLGDGLMLTSAWRAVYPGLCSSMNVSASSTIMLCVVVVVVIMMIMSRSLCAKPLKEDKFGLPEDFRVL